MTSTTSIPLPVLDRLIEYAERYKTVNNEPADGDCARAISKAQAIMAQFAPGISNMPKDRPAEPDDELAQTFALYQDLARRMNDPHKLLIAVNRLLLLYGAMMDEPENSKAPHLSLNDGIAWIAMPGGVELRYNEIDRNDDGPVDLRIKADRSGLYIEVVEPEIDCTISTAQLDVDQLRALTAPLAATPAPPPIIQLLGVTLADLMPTKDRVRVVRAGYPDGLISRRLYWALRREAVRRGQSEGDLYAELFSALHPAAEADGDRT